MKKILLACGVAAAIVGVTSCSGSGSSSSNDSFGDSLSTYIGRAQGYQLLSQYNNSLDSAAKANMKKDDILRGLKLVLMTDTTQQGYLTGINFGLQLAGQLYRYESTGIKIDRAKIYDAYAKAFSSDSASVEELREAQSTFQMLAQQAQQKMMAYYDAQEKAAKEAKMNSPEAKKNQAEGAAFIKAAKEKDPSIITTPSGMSYKVVKEGAGEPVGQRAATVKYKGQLIDGTVFDENTEGAQLTSRGTVPGFGEALSMMKKGSEYVIYIPDSLAYGVDGIPQAGIGPNSTLVFNVEVTDIK